MFLHIFHCLSLLKSRWYKVHPPWFMPAIYPLKCTLRCDGTPNQIVPESTTTCNNKSMQSSSTSIRSLMSIDSIPNSSWKKGQSNTYVAKCCLHEWSTFRSNLFSKKRSQRCFKHARKPPNKFLPSKTWWRVSNKVLKPTSCRIHILIQPVMDLRVLPEIFYFVIPSCGELPCLNHKGIDRPMPTTTKIWLYRYGLPLTMP
jgi:hypothetical protein